MIVRIDKNIPKLEPSVACIGYFDGVHRGHQQLIKQAIQEAKKHHVKSSIICFEPDPLDVITKKKNPHITSFKNRLVKMKEYGIDNIYVIKFSEEFMKNAPEVFITDYLNKMNLVSLISGFDYSFGYKGLGNNALLKKLGNFESKVVEEFKYYNQKISSTRIRKALLNGNFKLVNKLLGWNYFIEIKVLKSTLEKKHYLLECKLKDSQGILPNKECKNKDFTIKNNRIFVKSKIDLERNTDLLIVFENE